MSDTTKRAQQIRTHFEDRNSEDLKHLVNGATKSANGHLDAGAPLREGQPSVEDEKRREEFEIHIENLKNEAMKQFDRELYGDCLGTFRFLCELEPNNRTLKDYLELCRQQLAQETAVDASIEQKFAQPTVVRASGETKSNPQSISKSTGSRDAIQSHRDLDLRLPKSTDLKEPRDTTLRTVQSTGKQVSKPDTASATPRFSKQAVEPPSHSSALGRKFGLLAVIFLLVGILGIAYLKLPLKSWRTLRTDRSSSQNVTPGVSQPMETSPQLEAQRRLLQKAESAAALDHYVAPPGDNAFSYCKQALALGPASAEAQSLREDSLNKALLQARDSIQKNKFSEAGEIYSTLLELSRQESHFPLTTQEIQNEIEKLEFTGYPVLHDHRFGSCKGQLKMNAYVISFVPTGNSTDSFTEPLSEVTLFRPGDRLKIEIRAKTYRFESKTGKKAENRQQILTIYRELAKRTAREG